MQAQQTLSQEQTNAGFVDRLIAILIDGAILFVAELVLMMVLGTLIGGFISLVIALGYDIYFWTRSGQTPGKMVMGLKVVNAETGQLLDTGTAVLRYVCCIVSAIPLCLGFLWVIWDPEHLAWHDRLAKTRVIKIK